MHFRLSLVMGKQLTSSPVHETPNKMCPLHFIMVSHIASYFYFYHRYLNSASNLCSALHNVHYHQSFSQGQANVPSSHK